ncbi:MAG TPA: response regulator [Sediminibacterium sp.]|nr:response regulator [Sediminibacterium sp.]HQS56460.1 response regulator [Sediminibacterium sp.]
MEQLLNIENQMDTIRFVIADDNKINQYIIHFMLKGRYINFNFAENGEEAITALDADLEKQTILLLDLNMPDMDGYEVLELLAKNPKKYGKVKTICISAMHLDNTKEHGSIELCDYYLEKPVDKTQLLEKVESCIVGN